MKNTAKNATQSIQTNCKAYQIGRNHHQNICNCSNAAEHAILRRAILPFPLWEEVSGSPFRHHEDNNEPAPNEEAKLDVVPKGNKRENEEVCDDRSSRRYPTAERRTTERYVNIADEPAVIRAVPGAPKELRAVVVAHASDHVLWRVDSIHQRPKAEHAPGKKQLQPDDVKVEERQETELGSGIVAPNRGCFANRADIVKVQDELHGEKHKQESNAVSNGARPFNARGTMLGLRDVVVERQDRTCNV